MGVYVDVFEYIIGLTKQTSFRVCLQEQQRLCVDQAKWFWFLWIRFFFKSSSLVKSLVSWWNFIGYVKTLLFGDGQKKTNVWAVQISLYKWFRTQFVLLVLSSINFRSFFVLSFQCVCVCVCAVSLNVCVPEPESKPKHAYTWEVVQWARWREGSLQYSALKKEIEWHFL